jgi:ABC-type polar amino acid transport system ATPase subunit
MDQDEELASVFEERAEHLSQTELEKWTSLTTRDETLVDKLMGPGAKLLTGPRGSGKSTLLRTAYFRLTSTREVLPVYVNYSKSLALEPLFHRHASALQVFRQWLLMKVVVGVAEAFRDMKLPASADLLELEKNGVALINQLSTNTNDPSMTTRLSPNGLNAMLETWATSAGLKRVVLLLDDAAHAFSPEQQREFFEVFRELRSRKVSPKAAVYPGITSYSPFFNVGHEAETLEAWYRPEDPGYLDLMRGLVEKRLPAELRDKLRDRAELIDFLALASFGLPRGFLNMLDELLSGRITRQGAETAISEHAESVRGIFKALAAKLPRYRHFVDVGRELEIAILRTLAAYNRLHDQSSKKTTVIGLETPISAPLERMLNMLEYAGLVRSDAAVSRGVRGRFQRYTIHHSLLIAENAPSLGKSYQLSLAIDALKSKSSGSFARNKAATLLGEDFEARCTLALPPCKACGTSRLSEDQHFCMKCGSQLTDASVYEELLRATIDSLPLTKKKVDGIRKHTSIRTVHDVLLDDARQELWKVPGIGPVWAKRIRNMADEAVSV